MRLSYPATALDYRRLAQRRLPRFLFDYIDGGAGDEITLAANLADMAAIRLRQRVLVNVENVDTRATLAGEDCAMPLALAPVGMAGMMARRGEAQAVRAANAAGVPFTLSTVGICPLAEVQAASRAPFWFQLYMIRDRDVIVVPGSRFGVDGTLERFLRVPFSLPEPQLRDAVGRLARTWRQLDHSGVGTRQLVVA